MGCSASQSLAHASSGHVFAGQGIIYTNDKYYEQARVMLATVPVKPRIQIRRARSVGLISSGVWVYWRPGWNERTRQQRTEQGTIPTRSPQATRSGRN